MSEILGYSRLALRPPSRLTEPLAFGRVDHWEGKKEVPIFFI